MLVGIGGCVMIFELCKKMINMNKTEGILEKIDVFYLANRITKEEYEELLEMLGVNLIDD